jgi:hypothetical protein
MNTNRIALVFLSVVTVVVGSSWDSDRVRRARILVDIFEDLAREAFEERDEIRTMAFESSADRKILDETRFSKHIESKLESNEGEVFEALTNLKLAGDTDPKFGEYFTTLTQIFAPIVADLQRIYISLPPVSIRLRDRHTIIRRIIRDFFNWGVTAGTIVKSTGNSALIEIALVLIPTFADSTIGALASMDAEQGIVSRQFLNDIPDLKELFRQSVSVMDEISSICKRMVNLDDSHPVPSGAELEDLIRILESSLTRIIEQLPKTHKVGPLRLVYFKRTLELRHDEWKMILDTLKEIASLT